MPDAHKSVKETVADIFKTMFGERVLSLEGADAGAFRELLYRALKGSYPSKVAHEMAFHLADWNSNAAFLVALLLYPERFTYEEIEAGVIQLLVHVPHHVIAAARLGGHSTEDIFVKDELTRRPRAASKQARRSGGTQRRPASTSRRPQRT